MNASVILKGKAVIFWRVVRHRRLKTRFLGFGGELLELLKKEFHSRWPRGGATMTCVKETNMALEEPYTRRLHEVVKAIAQCFEDSVDVFVTNLSVSVRARWRYVWLVYGHGPDTHFPNAHQF